MEMFNAPNHVELGNPATGWGNSNLLPQATFGTITSTRASMRQIQFALKYQFLIRDGGKHSANSPFRSPRWSRALKTRPKRSGPPRSTFILLFCGQAVGLRCNTQWRVALVGGGGSWGRSTGILPEGDPRGARLAACASMLLWLGPSFVGRGIAFF